MAYRTSLPLHPTEGRTVTKITTKDATSARYPKWKKKTVVRTRGDKTVTKVKESARRVGGKTGNWDDRRKKSIKTKTTTIRGKETKRKQVDKIRSHRRDVGKKSSTDTRVEYKRREPKKQ